MLLEIELSISALIHIRLILAMMYASLLLRIYNLWFGGHYGLFAAQQILALTFLSLFLYDIPGSS